MGYFKGVVSLCFKKDIYGNIFFYPYGVFGRGFVIESENKANQIQKELIRRMKRDFLFMFFYCLLNFLPIFIRVDVSVFYTSLTLLIFAVSILMYLQNKTYISKVTKNLQREKKLSRQEYIRSIFEKWRETASHYNFFLLGFSGFSFPLCGYILVKGGASFVSKLISLTIILVMIPVAQIFEVLGFTDFSFLLFFDFMDLVIIQPVIETIFWGLYSFIIVGLGYMIFVKFQSIWSQLTKKLSLFYSSKSIRKTI